MQFFVNQDTDGEFISLADIKTTLSQGSNTISFNLTDIGGDCEPIFKQLYLRLKNS